MSDDVALRCAHRGALEHHRTNVLDARRPRIQGGPAGKTYSLKQLRAQLDAFTAGFDEEEPVVEPRPRTRGDCIDAPRPCPFASCRYHLFLEVSASGHVRFNFPDREIWELQETCALDVADRGGATLEEMGAALNITREGARQVEVKALELARPLLAERGLE